MTEILHTSGVKTAEDEVTDIYNLVIISDHYTAEILKEM